MDIKLIITKYDEQTEYFPFKIQKRVLMFDDNKNLLNVLIFFSDEFDALINRIGQNNFNILTIQEIDTAYFNHLEMNNI